MTAQGSPYTRLRRALDHGNLTEALSAASELERVGLVEALELCLLLCDRAPAPGGQPRKGHGWGHLADAAAQAAVRLAKAGQSRPGLLSAHSP